MPEKVLFARPESLHDVAFHYCPGCHHGIIHRLVAEAIDELGVRDRTVGIMPVGCSGLAYDYFNFDTQETAHGRAPAAATGVKRAVPDAFVFTYQGDGDLASIGLGEIMHAAARGEKISTIFVNNAVYGMTGGQMAPTTLVGQVTTTSPYGRKKESAGMPLRIAEMISVVDGAQYVARVAVNNSANMAKAKAAIVKAFEVQLSGIGFSLVEVLSACPTNWGVTPLEAQAWVAEKMIPFYPLGVLKTPEGVAK
jgi:2-oxoglutarate ferredoxin oxidoreductase subunit beta